AAAAPDYAGYQTACLSPHRAASPVESQYTMCSYSTRPADRPPPREAWPLCAWLSAHLDGVQHNEAWHVDVAVVAELARGLTAQLGLDDAGQRAAAVDDGVDVGAQRAVDAGRDRLRDRVLVEILPNSDEAFFCPLRAALLEAGMREREDEVATWR